jgi:hypothetical protein
MRGLVVIALLSGCSSERRALEASPAGGVNYTLTCNGVSTATNAQMQCARLDTRSGEVVIVDYMRLPQSSGSTATGNATPGRFQLACAAPSSDNHGEFLCVRLNTETGELLLVNLTKLAVFPAAPS